MPKSTFTTFSSRKFIYILPFNTFIFMEYKLCNLISRINYIILISVIHKNNSNFTTIIQFVIIRLFILISYISYSYKFRVPFHIKCVEHSWRDYIYSPSTLYDDSEPFVISEFISGLTSQSSPILLDLTTPIILPKESFINSFSLLWIDVCSLLVII